VTALSVSMGFGRPVRHLGLLGVDAAGLDPQDVITAGLEKIHIGTAGHFTTAGDDGPQLEPLVTSSERATTVPAVRFQFLSDPGELLNDFRPSGERYVLAARLNGPLESAFPDGPPMAGAEDAETDDDADAEAAATATEEAEAAAEGEPGADDAADDGAKARHLASTENANVVLVGDVDVLSDRLWVQSQSFLGQQLLTAFASNGDFVVNAL